MPSLVRSSGSSTLRAAVSTGSRLYIWKTKPMCRARHAGELAARQRVDAIARDVDRALGRRVEPADQVEQRRLAGAGRSHQREEVARGDVERDPLEDVDLLAAAIVDLVQVADFDQRFHSNSFTALVPSLLLARSDARAVGQRRSTPSTTMRSPAFSPETISTCSPSVDADVDRAPLGAVLADHEHDRLARRRCAPRSWARAAAAWPARRPRFRLLLVEERHLHAHVRQNPRIELLEPDAHPTVAFCRSAVGTVVITCAGIRQSG